VLGLLKELQERLGMSMLLITHDLGVVANMADEVVVIYHGEIVEAGSVEHIFRHPGHAYTKALMRAVPEIDTAKSKKLVSLREIDHVIPQSMRRDRVKADAAAPPLMRVRGLTRSFTIQKDSWLAGEKSRVLAVNDVSFDIRRGECFGIVGESGSGKSTVSKLMMRAITADAGTIEFDNGSMKCDVRALEGKALKEFRKRMQIVFQDPFSSLSPRSTVLNILREPLEIHGLGNMEENTRTARELMALVGLSPTYLNRYPHSFSGGQRQRIGIARALALSPDLLICDEPVSALDVSVQAQILNLLKKLQAELGLTMVFISHNLAVVKYIADRIAVMRKGRIVEIAPCETLFADPVHPYTKKLLAAVPHADLDHRLDFPERSDEIVDDAESWDPVFRPGGAGELKLTPVSAGHYVLAREAFAREVTA
jgi:peptide/nickel transport system ATP-binding protein